MESKLTIFIEIKATKEQTKKLRKRQKELKAKGYPQVGDKITAIKSGYVYTETNEFGYTLKEGKITKGKVYTVIDNLDLSEGYFHIIPDIEGVYIRLTLEVLKEWFGIEI